MSLSSVLVRVLMPALLVVWVSGCFPLPDGPTDEEKDPHFLAGKSRLNNMDYDGAIEAFENALISNPKSAAAHFELGLLYEEKKSDYAAAIYHFDRHLSLRPESNMAETVKQHILACKLELARTVSFLLVNRQVQDELRRVYTSNAVLLQKIEQLKSEQIDQATVYSNKLAALVLAAAQAKADPPAAAEQERRPAYVERRPTPTVTRPAPRPVSVIKTHVVRPGETMAAISKRYNIKLTSLQVANPGLDSRRLKPGQIVYLPGGRD